MDKVCQASIGTGSKPAWVGERRSLGPFNPQLVPLIGAGGRGLVIWRELLEQKPDNTSKYGDSVRFRFSVAL